VVSELRKPRPELRVVTFVSAQPGDQLFISDVTLAEIVYSIEQLPDAARRADIHLWLERTLRPLFTGRTLSITEAVLVRWKTLVVEGRKRRHTFGQPDLFIAALAELQDLVVVSRDVGEFIAAGTPVFDPWTGALHAWGTTTMIEASVTTETVAKIIKARS
jgi:predicted nucleic acid-binding protein